MRHLAVFCVKVTYYSEFTVVEVVEVPSVDIFARFLCEFPSLDEYKLFFGNVVYVYVCKKCEKFGGFFVVRSESNTIIRMHACTVYADQVDLATSFCFYDGVV